MYFIIKMYLIFHLFILLQNKKKIRYLFKFNNIRIKKIKIFIIFPRESETKYHLQCDHCLL